MITSQFRVPAILLVLILLGAPFTASSNEYVEDFTTAAYMDPAATTAWWDTQAGELKLYSLNMGLVGEIDTHGNAGRVVIHGNYAFVADGSNGLLVVDLTDPSALTIVGGYPVSFPYHVISVAVFADYAFVGLSPNPVPPYDGQLHVLDITNPTSLTAVSVVPSWIGNPNDIKIAGNVCYVANGGSGLRSLDITDPTAPNALGDVAIPGQAVGVAIAGDYAYVASFTSGLQVIDISDPANMSIAGSESTPGWAQKLTITGNYVYLADGAHGLEVIDVSDPTNPSLSGNCMLEDLAFDICVSGDWAFVSGGSAGLHAIDVSDPANPLFQATYDCDGSALGCALDGLDVYVSAGSAGLQVVRVAEVLDSLVESGSYLADIVITDFAISGNYVFMVGNYLSALDYWHGRLIVVNVTEPDDPIYVAECSIDAQEIGRPHVKANCITVEGDYAFVGGVGFDDPPADYSGKAWAINISDPTAPGDPVEVGAPGGRSTHCIEVAGNYAYVGISGNPGFSIAIFDITDPEWWTHRGTRGPWAVVQDIEITGDYLYFSAPGLYGDDSTFQIWDLSDPELPVPMWESTAAVIAEEIEISGNYAFIGEGRICRIYNITEPGNPDQVSSIGLYLNEYFESLSVQGNYLFCGGSDGTIVVDISDPTNSIIVSVDNRYYAGAYNNVVAEADKVFVSYGLIGNPHWPSLLTYTVFETGLNAVLNTGQSLSVNSVPNTIMEARIEATGTGSIEWEMSCDGGENWESVEPEAWHVFATTGIDLRWRATLQYEDGMVPPICDHLQIEWLDEIPSIPDWANLQWPPNLAVSPSHTSDQVYGQVFLDGVTNAPGQGPDISAQLGYGPEGTDPAVDPGWVFVEATYLTDVGDNDEYIASFNAPTSGTYDYCYRFSYKAGPWIYGDLNGSNDGYTTDQAGTLVVADEPGWWNLQWPPDMMVIPGEESPNVYGQVWLAGITDTPGQGHGILVELGYGPDDSDPTSGGWQWVDVTYHLDVGNNDEYVATIIAGEAGVYDYCYRYAINGGSWVYGDLDGSDNGYSPEQSGVLVVLDPSPVPGSIASSVFALHEPQPNPFNPQTTIAFELPKREAVNLRVFDLSGRLVKELVGAEEYTPGRHEVVWNGRDDTGRQVASGTYFYRLEAGAYSETKRMVLVK